MNVLTAVRQTLGMTANRLYRCWECDANFHENSELDECRYCGSGGVQSL